MSDYTELVKALRGLANGIWKNSEYTWFGGEEKVFADAADAIEELKAQLPKRGEWINHKDEHQCSACRETVVVDEIRWEQIGAYDYCPNCGAKMEVRDDKA